MDDFDAAVRASVSGPPQDPAQTARFGMQQAVGTNPDLYSELRRVSQITGVPISTVQADPDTAKRQAQLGTIDFSDLAQTSPSTAALLSDVDKAKFSHDDIGNLSAVERAIRSFGSAAVDVGKYAVSAPGAPGGGVTGDLSRFSSTYLGASTIAGLQDMAGVGAKLLDKVNPFTTSAEEAAVLYRNDPAGLARFNASAAGFLPRFTQAMGEGSAQTMEGVSPEAKADYGSLKYATTNPSEAAYLSPVKVLGDALRSVPTSLAMGLSIYLTRGAAAKAEADALAAGMSPAIARTAGIEAASATMAKLGASTEGMVGYAQQANQTVGDLQKLSDEKMAASPEYQKLLAEGYAPDAARQAVTQRTAEQSGLLAGIVDAAVNHVGGAFLGRIIGEGGKLLPRIGKAGLTESLTEFFQSGGEQFGQNLATQKNVDPGQSLTEGVLENSIAGLAVGGVSGGFFGGLGGLGRNQAKAEAAQQTTELLTRIMQMADASKVRERDPDTFQAFLQQATQDGPLEKVYINPAEMQANGLDLTALEHLMPSAMSEMAQAVATGADVAIPTSELATRLPGSELEQSVLQHLKTEPDGFSQVGAQQYMQTHGESVRAEVEKVLAEHQADDAFKQSMQSVQDNVLAQLHAANRFTDDVNAPYAALWGSFFGVQAARLGMSPQALFDRFGPRIVGESVGGGLDQGGHPTTPEFRKWFAASTVVNDNGKPLVVYHGTNADFDTFSSEHAGKATQAANAGLGFFFVSRPDVADKYASRNGSEGANVMPVYLALTNPIRISAPNMMEADKLLTRQLGQMNDGAIIEVGAPGAQQTVYMVRGQSQIKSATGNNGNFDASNPSILEQPAYHGSPHDFSRFSTEHIGSGEGAQAYGWGLYFAENEGIARGYHEKLSSVSSAQTLIQRNDGDVDKAIAEVERKVEHYKQLIAAGGGGDMRRATGMLNISKGQLDALQRIKSGEPQSGGVYQVDIPDDVVARMLLWDRPLSEQPESVRAALEKQGYGVDSQEMSGEEIYKDIAWDLEGAAGYEPASKLLESLGIPGVKYLDAGSRGHVVKLSTSKGEYASNSFASRREAEDYADRKRAEGFTAEISYEGTHNLVVFNDKNVTLTHKDGSPVTAAERDEFFQNSGPQTPPRATFHPETNTIALLKAADLSSFLHESGHFFLEVMGDLAGQPDAPQQIKDDFDTFLKWTGVADAATWNAMTLDEKRAHHEDFARGFEAYLFEGKAPSIELQGVFQRFRAWLLNVYRSIASLNVRLTPEIRGVFDRMLATTEQIRTAEDVRGYEAMFQTKPAGMTDQEWSVYQTQANDATQQAITLLEARSLRDMKWLSGAKGRELKKLQKEAKARRDEVHADVTAEVDAMPVYQAISAIKEQRKADPSDRSAVKEWGATRDAEEARLAEQVKTETLATPEAKGLKGLQKGQFLAKAKRQMANEVEARLLAWEKTNPKPTLNIPEPDLEALAALHGFTSGDELRRAIMEAPPAKEVIAGMTDRRMLEQYGDLTSPEAMERAAEEAIHNEARLKFAATEANALRKATGEPALLAAAVRQFAADIIARTKVRDLNPSIYTAAEKRAATAANKAADAGKLQDAAVQKRNQLINGYAAKAALDARAEVDSIVTYLKRFNKDGVYKSLDADYIEQIHALLERFDLRNASLKAIDKRTSLAAWLQAQQDAGLEPEIDPDLVNEAQRTSYKNMPMEQLRGLRDAVKQIEHLGRLKHKLLTAKDKRDYEQIRDGIVASITEHSGGKLADNRTRPTTLNAAIRLFNGYLLEHRKVASLVKELDGFKDGGAMWDAFVRTMNEAGDKEATMRADAAKKLAALVAPMRSEGSFGKSLFIEGAATSEDRAKGKTGSSFTREERIGIALNMGNQGNIQRLLDGEGWNLGQVKRILDTLTSTDWRFVQNVWDFLESYRPEIGAKEKRVYGKEPDWVQPQPLTVLSADGKTVTLAGGYYPVKYDPSRSLQAQEHADADVAKQQMKGAFTSSTTRRSFTKSRVEEVKGRPLLYSTDGLFNGVNEIIHDLSWHEWLIDANKLLRSRSIGNAILTHYGSQVMAQFKSGVKDIAAGEFPATHAFERGLASLRGGTVIAGLAMNIMNSVINVQGLTQSMVRVGSKWTAVGIGRLAANPRALARDVAEKSEMMANRAKTLNREVNEIQSLVRDKSKLRQAADRFMFLPLTITQQVVDLPTWWGAYQKALDAGETEARAVSLADQSVLDSQSGGQVKDLAKIQRGGQFLKLWTTFYGFFSSTYNLSVERAKATDFKSPTQVVKLATDYALLLIVPALLGTILKNAMTGGDWDEDKLAKKAIGDQISYMMGMLVGVRDVAGAVQMATGTSEFNQGYAGPAGVRFFGEVYKLAMQAHQGEIDGPFLKSLNNVLGILLHYPSGQINRTVEGTLALADGTTTNPLAVVAGPPPKK